MLKYVVCALRRGQTKKNYGGVCVFFLLFQLPFFSFHLLSLSVVAERLQQLMTLQVTQYLYSRRAGVVVEVDGMDADDGGM